MKTVKTAVLIASSILAGLLVVGGIFAAVNLLNAEDSGVAMCKAMADQSRTVARTGDTPMSTAEYRRIRAEFASSGYEDIREAGTSFIDTTWQASQVSEDDMSILAYAGPIVTGYGKLVTACANHEVYLPSLSELTTIRESASPSPRSTD